MYRTRQNDKFQDMSETPQVPSTSISAKFGTFFLKQTGLQYHAESLYFGTLPCLSPLQEERSLEETYDPQSNL